MLTCGALHPVLDSRRPPRWETSYGFAVTSVQGFAHAPADTPHGAETALAVLRDEPPGTHTLGHGDFSAHAGFRSRDHALPGGRVVFPRSLGLGQLKLLPDLSASNHELA